MNLNYSKLNGLVPAIVQDGSTGKILMLGFMNEEALAKTRQEKKVTFWSRTKKRLWTKGEESGNFLHVSEILTDCDNDTVLIKARPEGPVCHTGKDTCFGEENRADDFLSYLEGVIEDRKNNPTDKSYTASLFAKGINKIAQKVGEEATELVIEAKDNDTERLKNEAADLVFHLLVLLRAKDVAFDDVVEVLRGRHRGK